MFLKYICSCFLFLYSCLLCWSNVANVWSWIKIAESINYEYYPYDASWMYNLYASYSPVNFSGLFLSKLAASPQSSGEANKNDEDGVLYSSSSCISAFRSITLWTPLLRRSLLLLLCSHLLLVPVVQFQ